MKATDPQPLMLTRKQAAKLLAISESSLTRLEKAGVFRPVRLGNAVRHFRQDIEATARSLVTTTLPA